MLTRPFGRDERAFRLLVPQWCDVEKTCDSGLCEIAARLAPLVSLLGSGLPEGGLLSAMANGMFGRARLNDVREVVLQGLIGGGLTSTEAGALVRMVFDEALKAGKAPMLEFGPLAFDILSLAILGLPDEPPPTGEIKAAPTKARSRRSPTAKPASRLSTPPSA